MKVWIAREDYLLIPEPLLENEGAGSHRMIGDEATFVAVHFDGFARDRRSESHRQRIQELRIGFEKLELNRVIIERSHALDVLCENFRASFFVLSFVHLLVKSINAGDFTVEDPKSLRADS